MPCAGAAHAAQDEAAAPPYMEFGTWGGSGFARFTVKPGDDFFAYVNGKWVRNNPMPAEYSALARSTCWARNRLPTSRRWSTSWWPPIPHQAPPSGASSTPTAPTSTPRRSTPGARPGSLARPIRRAGNLSDLAELFGQPGFPAGWRRDRRFRARQLYRQRRLRRHGLPDRDYLDDTDAARNPGEVSRVPGVHARQGRLCRPGATAQAVYDFEDKVAELEWARQAMRNRDITYNKLSRAERGALAQGFRSIACSLPRRLPTRTISRQPAAADGERSPSWGSRPNSSQASAVGCRR